MAAKNKTLPGQEKELIVQKTIEKRLTQLKKSLSDKNFDTLMVLKEENRRYLSGFTGEDSQFEESAGALFITDEKLILATDSRFETQAENEAPLYEIRCYEKGLVRELPDILRRLKTKRLGFESRRMSYHQYIKIDEQLQKEKIAVDLVDADNIVEKLRVTKDHAEVETIKKALDIAESVFKDFIANSLLPGMTEKQAAWAMEKGMREAGAESLSFPTIVASGPNSALPHAIPGDRTFQKGEPILFDWGAKIDGYCSDTSRTVVIGTPDERFKKIFTTLYDAQQKAVDAIRPGITGKEVDTIARSHIDKTEFKGKFSHGLGHGVGLAVHESPRLSKLSDTKLEQGMVVTVEPGIYIPGWGGIRLENMVLVRENDAEVLNRLDCRNFLIGK